MVCVIITRTSTYKLIMTQTLVIPILNSFCVRCVRALLGGIVYPYLLHNERYLSPRGIVRLITASCEEREGCIEVQLISLPNNTT